MWGFITIFQVVGAEILVHLIDYFLNSLQNNNSTDDVMTILSESRVHFFVSMNPDGFELAYNNRPQGGDCSSVYGRYSDPLKIFPRLLVSTNCIHLEQGGVGA